MSEVESWFAKQDEEINKQMKPCPFCGCSLPDVRRRGFYWCVRCPLCWADVRAKEKEEAVSKWNRRDRREYVPLGEHTYLLPLGQRFSHLMVYQEDNNVVSFIDYIDEQVASSFDVDLGRFRICDRKVVRDE